jgi:Flp pilus assembly protein CpaB
MKPKTMILLFVAASCGLVASYMTSKLLAERKAPPPEETVNVVVAITKVPRFTHLKEPEKFFVVKEFRKSDAPKSYFDKIEDIKGKRVNKDFKADVHISPEDVADRLLSPLPIPDGFGAVAIKVNAVSAVSYFIGPGDKVDVVLTEKSNDKPSALTFLRDVLVLSVQDRIVRENAESGSGSSTIQAQTVSVALKADDIQLVKLAESLGELTLVLRKEGDLVDRSSKITTREDIQKAARGSVKPDAVATTQPTPEVKPADPNKLPFGLNLEEIRKAEKPEVPEVKVPELPVAEKFHEVEQVDGDGPPTIVGFYKLPNGRVVRQDHPVLVGFRKSDQTAAIKQ